MKPSGILIPLFVFMSTAIVGRAAEDQIADALFPEQIRLAMSGLDDPIFFRREEAADQLFGYGFDAVFPLEYVAKNGSPEASVRAFDLLARLYRLEDERIYDAVERVFRRLMRIDAVAVTARAERLFDSLADLRQTRGVNRFLQLGGYIQFEDPNPSRQSLGLSPIEFILIDRDWKGTDDDLKLIENIQDVHYSQVSLILARGAHVSDKTILDLRATLPLLSIQPRGPAALGVKNAPRSDGCVIDSVKPGSTADNAGLQGGDRILEIDGEEIENFEDLVMTIEKREAGEKVPMVFNRRGEIHRVTAELLPWRNPNAGKRKEQAE
jgi:hypothetical protein